VSVATAPSPFSIRPVERADSDSLASMLLAAYRGTVDDEGEGDDEARAAIDEYFERMEWQHSVVLEVDEQLVTMSFVVIVDSRHYIDPVATIAAFKGRGCGRTAVLASLRSLDGAGVQEVGRDHRWQHPLGATVRRVRVRASGELGHDGVHLNRDERTWLRCADGRERDRRGGWSQ